MGYKLKPKKAVLARFKVTKKGKVKRHHSLTSHLRSSRTSAKKRQLRRPAMMAEGMARNVRRMVGMSHKNPIRAAHEQRVIEAQKQAEAAPATK